MKSKYFDSKYELLKTEYETVKHWAMGFFLALISVSIVLSGNISDDSRSTFEAIRWVLIPVVIILIILFYNNGQKIREFLKKK